MPQTNYPRIVFLSCLAVVCPLASAQGQHQDIQVQGVSEKLTTGTADFDDGNFTLGMRVFSREFNSLYAVNNPGFNSIGTTTGTLPPGSEALPGDAELSWDFLPMKVDGYAANLMHWSGVGSTPAEVAFGPTPAADYSLSLFGENNQQAAADGTDQLIIGSVVDTTASDGFIHAHRYFFLDDDTNPDNFTVAEPGVYLVSMRLRMPTLDRSDPLYLVWATPGISVSTLEVASTWVADHVDELAPSFRADFDGDLDVDGTDLLTWQRGFGKLPDARQIDGDADSDHAVSAADLELWQGEYGSNLASFPGAASGLSSAFAVPEPRCLGLCLLATSCIILRKGRPPTSQSVSTASSEKTQAFARCEVSCKMSSFPAFLTINDENSHTISPIRNFVARLVPLDTDDAVRCHPCDRPG